MKPKNGSNIDNNNNNKKKQNTMECLVHNLLL